MDKKVFIIIACIVLFLLLLGGVLAVSTPRGGVVAKPVPTKKVASSFVPIVKTLPVVNNWVYVNKAGKATSSHKYCTKRMSKNLNAASWGPSVGAYFSGDYLKYGTTWKSCLMGKDGKPDAKATGCVTGQWTYVESGGKVVGGKPITGCTTMNAKGELGKEKAWCATKVAYVYGNKFGTKKELCSEKSKAKKTVQKIVKSKQAVAKQAKVR